jgi:hypothetical protein
MSRCVRDRIHQTARRAPVGETLAARSAGRRPARPPIAIAATIPPAQASGGMTADHSLAEA